MFEWFGEWVGAGEWLKCLKPWKGDKLIERDTDNWHLNWHFQIIWTCLPSSGTSFTKGGSKVDSKNAYFWIILRGGRSLETYRGFALKPYKMEK